MLCDGRLKVRDDVSAQLARTLLDATVAHPRPAGGPSTIDVTVVIPVRDNLSGVRRFVSSLRGLRVIVVDDGSFPAIEPEDFVGAHCDVEVLRHPRSKGPAAARNTGLAACTTDFVAFLDSDVAPRRGWLEALLGHFCDPTVALVAPRIVGLSHSENVVARYEALHSSLDLGEREAPVLPHSTVSYVPSAAIICRCSAIRGVGGFDETLQSGEDVDLCWRLLEAGARLRYEPIAQVAHDHRTELRDWLARKAFYGGSAAPLSVRHPDKTAPVVISGWALMTWILMAFGTSLGQLASIVVAVLTVAGLRGRCAPPRLRLPMLWRSPPAAWGQRRCSWRRPCAGTIGRWHCSPLRCRAISDGSCWSRPSWTAWWTGFAAGTPSVTMPNRSGC